MISGSGGPTMADDDSLMTDSDFEDLMTSAPWNRYDDGYVQWKLWRIIHGAPEEEEAARAPKRKRKKTGAGLLI